MSLSHLISIVTAGAVAICDLRIKKKIEEADPSQVDEKEILGGHIRITRFFNEGAVLGLMKQNQAMLKALQAGLTGLIGILWVHDLTHSASPLRRIGLGLLFGGAVSNCADRWTKDGKVTDYFRICIGSRKLESIIFNIGDLGIFLGAILSVLGL